jgi:GT2 family glycosyltransferase
MHHLADQYRRISESALFDKDYYLNKYAALIPSEGGDPIEHFIKIGWLLDCDPSTLFSTRAYLMMYPDVKKSGINPLFHYLVYGIKENRIILSVDNAEKMFPAVLKQNIDLQLDSPGTYIEKSPKYERLLAIISANEKSQLSSPMVDVLLNDYISMLMDQYNFQQQPLIRIASFLTRKITSQRVNSFLDKLVFKYSKWSNPEDISLTGLKPLLNPENVIVGEVFSQISLLQENMTTLSDHADQITRYFCENPQTKPDILCFMGDTRTKDILPIEILPYCSMGYRVIIIRFSKSGSTNLEVKMWDKQIFEISIPMLQNQESEHGLMNNSLRKQFDEISQIFCIYSAIIFPTRELVEDLSIYLQNEYGWKAISENTANSDDLQMPLRVTNTHHFTPIGSSAEALAKFDSACVNLFPKTSIIVVTYNNLELTKLCLHSIFTNTNYPNYEVVVVDNYSQDDTVKFLNELQVKDNRVKVIFNDQNLGFAAANNQGARVSTGEYLVFLNNDTIVTPGWLGSLMMHLQTGVGMVGPVTNAIGNEAKIYADYHNLFELKLFAHKRAFKFHKIGFPIRVLALYCCMISAELFKKLGGLDEMFGTGMFEDDDFAMKLQAEGLELRCAEDVFIHHFHGASFNKINEAAIHKLFNENKLKFETKWGIEWLRHKTRI